ncbi:hypothetical protein GC175_02275 [bacterium]|nr:hypothetical protein [bacterium]
MSRLTPWLRQIPARVNVIAGSAALLAALVVLFTLFGPRIADAVSIDAKPAVSVAAVTPVISYQARLANPTTGAPLNGTFTFVFRLYNVATEGTALWTETKDLTAVNGLVTTLLGDVTALPATVFNGQNLWLGIKVGADPEAAPRQRFAAVPYAMYSDNADRLDGQDSAFFRNANNINAGTLSEGRIPDIITRDSEVKDIVATIDGAGSGLDADLLDGLESTAFVRTTGPTSISGNSAAAAMLSVTQNGSQNGVFATTASTDPGEAALHGRAGTAGPILNGVAGVFGTSATGRGVVASSTSNDALLAFSTNAVGVKGQSSTSDGIEGLAAATSGAVHGVYGISNSTNNGAGVRGDGSYVGVWGEGTRWGVYGRATGASNSYGVWGSETSGTNTWAGYFAGKVRVTGDLSVFGSVSKGSGTFKIDHPLDPENKYLYHSFVESPDMMNVYNGNVTLGANGEAVVQLPDYFQALNRDFRYQLTPIGGPGPNLYIAQEVQGNTFRIAGGSPNLQVSWQVTGIRQDPYANANRVQVEVDKPAEERGTYLYPEAYGKDRTLGLEYKQEALMSHGPMQTSGIAPRAVDAVTQPAPQQ